ncbi:MAG: 4Fe-4S binding protein [Chloroflexi bacterium]|jgi:MinD superfamily P-loop ATPase|nr:ATP-binding protein [Anaerolineaceae bacterium]NMB90500.1 4Fe-4S binding protein [Chloroflexota bacterium]
MKQLVVLSGKGGTGKTSVSAALAHLSSLVEASPRPVLVDADVDAANLSLILQPDAGCPNEFWGGSLAVIDPDACRDCGACVPVCRYDAISSAPMGQSTHQVDPLACDGCAACVYACPHAAVHMVQQQEGNWFRSDSAYGTLFHAELFPGRENSGKLVTLIKQQARLYALETGARVAIIDGPPGIGCPVISACAGADLGLIVTEPGAAGIHDLKRVAGTLRHFRVPTVICINKADLYSEGTRAIHEFAAGEGIEVVGEIPYDEHVPQAMTRGEPVPLHAPGAPAARSMQAIWQKTVQRLSCLEA